MTQADEKKQHVVSKEFKTVNKTFSVGGSVSEDDIHPEGHLSFEDWKKRGFISELKADPVSSKISREVSAFRDA